MKQHRSINNIKLGVFVLAGAAFLVLSLYMIGRNRNLFGSTIIVSTHFSNISGLVPGNNVRFAGIDVGTVRRIVVVNDTSVMVEMMIEEAMAEHIRTNSVASIGTDGLVGNKIVNINSVRGSATAIDDGGVISSLMPLETDEMLRTLQTTNLNIAVISANLRDVSARLNGSASLWNLLADTVIATDLQGAVSHFNHVGANTELLTKDVRAWLTTLREGHGVLPTLFADSTLTFKLESSVANLQRTTRNLDSLAYEWKTLGSTQSNGPARWLLTDTAASGRLSRTLRNAEQGTGRFNENMEAMKSNFLFRRYFRKQEKKNAATKPPPSGESSR